MNHTKFFASIIETFNKSFHKESDYNTDFENLWNILQKSYIESINQDLTDGKDQLKDYILNKVKDISDAGDRTEIVLINFLATIAHLCEEMAGSINKEYRYSKDKNEFKTN